MTKLIIFILIFLLFIRVVNSLFKGIYRVTGDPRKKSKQRYYQKKPREEGDVKIDDSTDKKKGKFGDDFKGGEYIDYEEVK